MLRHTYRAKLMDPAELVPWPDNPRQNEGEPVAHLADQIQRYGWTQPITARKANLEIITGHTRQLAALELGLVKVPVLLFDVSEEEAHRMALADNPKDNPAHATWDDPAVRNLLHRWAEEGWDLGGLGWSATELEAIAAGPSSPYTRKVVAPIYTPTGKVPPVGTLLDEGRAGQLLEAIAAADLPDDVHDFLEAAAYRHHVFHYGRIAEYYAHAPPEIQRLMEDSALVIIDFEQAIEQGYVTMSEEIAAAHRRDYDQ